MKKVLEAFKQKEKVLALLAFSVILFLCGYPAGAADVHTEGDYEFTVEHQKSTITRYKGTAANVTVPSTLGGYPVVSIGHDAFYACESLVSVVIPDSIGSVGQAAFQSCGNLERVHWPQNTAEIASAVFEYCYKLKEINLSNVARIDTLAFSDCTSLETVDLYVTSFGENVGRQFEGCTGLKKAVFHNVTETIASDCFRNCTGLEQVVLVEGLKTIGDNAFRGCASLGSITLPASLNTIGYYAFQESGLKNLTVPANVSTVRNQVFVNCTALETVSYDCPCPITWEMFRGCISLRDIKIGAKVPAIEADAFSGTRALISLTIPKNTEVKENAFAGAEGLGTIYCYAGSSAEKEAKAEGLKVVILPEEEQKPEQKPEQNPVQTVSVSLNKSKATLYKLSGKNKLTLKVVKTGTTAKVTWKSSKKSVATVSAKGVVTAKKTGTTTITASVGGKKATCKITVKKPSFKLKKSSVTLKKGKNTTIKYTAKPSNKVTFKSSDKKIVTVSSKGKVVAKKKGTATITVRCNGITRKLCVKVK